MTHVQKRTKKQREPKIKISAQTKIATSCNNQEKKILSSHILFATKVTFRQFFKIFFEKKITIRKVLFSSVKPDPMPGAESYRQDRKKESHQELFPHPRKVRAF